MFYNSEDLFLFSQAINLVGCKWQTLALKHELKYKFILLSLSWLLSAICVLSAVDMRNSGTSTDLDRVYNENAGFSFSVSLVC